LKSIALYGRVSSESQEKQATISSQVAALTERAKADGHAVLATDVYADDGYSGTILVRPALEKLRDRAAEGRLDVLYVLNPDRLARRYAYQVVLLDEFARHGVSVVFLNGPTGRTAEDELLVQVQGMIAEYERAKILERSRRGKLHKARNGIINPLSGAPYGYQYVRKSESESARYQVLLHEAKVVRDVFRMFVEEQVTTYGIAKRLSTQAALTRMGHVKWDTGAVWRMLKNPAYMGRAAYGKTVMMPSVKQLRLVRGRNAISRRSGRSVPKPPDQWLSIPVPAIVSTEMYAAAQDQLERNRRMSQRNARGQRYLLQGLVCCRKCGYGFYGRMSNSTYPGAGPLRGYYYCGGSVVRRFGDKAVCHMPSVRVEQLDSYVWASVKEVVQDPGRIVEEWTRRGSEDSTVGPLRTHRDECERLLAAQEQILRRLQDAYEAGAIDLAELTERNDRVRARIRRAHEDLQRADADLSHTVEITAIAGKLSLFADQVRDGIEGLDWIGRRHMIRTLVAKIEIDEDGATVVYRVPGIGQDPGGGPLPTPSSEPSKPPDPISCLLHTGRERNRLVVEIQSEFVGMRTKANGVQLVLSLVFDPSRDHLGREDVPFQEEAVASFERFQGLVEGCRSLRHVLGLFG
jgi:site-specific DNA recombinase